VLVDVITQRFNRVAAISKSSWSVVELKHAQKKPNEHKLYCKRDMNSSRTVFTIIIYLLLRKMGAFSETFFSLVLFVLQFVDVVGRFLLFGKDDMAEYFGVLLLFLYCCCC
jgi:hypothetical protein